MRTPFRLDLGPSRVDPEFHEVWRARKAEADRQFRKGEISEAVYEASLFSLGYRGEEIRSERNLILMEKQNG